MPLPLEAEAMLGEFAAKAGDFALFGIALNPKTGEMATFSSHGMEPGKVLGFLQDSASRMIEAAANNELTYVGGDSDKAIHTQAAAGDKSGIIH